MRTWHPNLYSEGLFRFIWLSYGPTTSYQANDKLNPLRSALVDTGGLWSDAARLTPPSYFDASST